MTRNVFSDTERPERLTQSVIPNVGDRCDNIESHEALSNLYRMARFKEMTIWYMVVNRTFYYVEVPSRVVDEMGYDHATIRSFIKGLLKPW